MAQGDPLNPIEEEEQTYKQELGLKKMLYRYEHQNEQLKAQIKALTQRLADIRAKKQEPPAPSASPEKPNEYRLNLLKQEMKSLYSEIEKTTLQIKKNKEEINQYQEIRCIELTNQVRKEEKQIETFKKQIERYEKMQQQKNFALQAMDLHQSTLRISTHSDKLKQIEHDLQQTRKSIRELERNRDQVDRSAIKRQSYVVGLNTKTRQYKNIGRQSHPVVHPDESRAQKGLWHMQYTQQNYNKVKQELQTLQRQKQRIIGSLKNENLLLKNRFAQLSQDAEQFNKSIHLPQIQHPRVAKKITLVDSNHSVKLNQSINSSRAHSPPRLLNVGPKEFERSNDKNYQPRKLRKIEWESANYRTNGIQWNDAHLRSPIAGINLWFDGSLVGIQFLHRMGESSQHLHLVTKSINPVQYRLTGNDYLENVILWISDNKITGIELTSKNGRHDSFGNKAKGRKFDFAIKDPEKPVFSYGRFRISNNISEITKLGFESV